MTKAEEMFQTICPDKDFKLFLNQWAAEELGRRLAAEDSPDPTEIETSRICPGLAFDPRNKRFVKPFASPPVRLGGRRKNPEFDVYKFLTEKDENEDGFGLKMDCFADEDEIFDCAYDEPEKEYMMADQSLRKIASLVVELNNSCNYRLMDIQGEARVR